MTKRQPAGIPTGGEFAANEHDESSSPLTSAPPDIRLSVEDQKDRVQLLRAAAAKAESDDPKERPSGWWSHSNRGATREPESAPSFTAVVNQAFALGRSILILDVATYRLQRRSAYRPRVVGR